MSRHIGPPIIYTWVPPRGVVRWIEQNGPVHSRYDDRISDHCRVEERMQRLEQAREPIEGWLPPSRIRKGVDSREKKIEA